MNHIPLGSNIPQKSNNDLAEQENIKMAFQILDAHSSIKTKE